MALPEAQVAVLTLLGRAFVDYERRTGARAVLVGGAAVSIFTGGAYHSGDFDVVAASDEALAGELRDVGFAREDRAGRLRGGWYHSDFPAYGVEAVSGTHFDGLADEARVMPIEFNAESRIYVAPGEDMIADRLGQFAATPNDKGPLRQAKVLLLLNRDLDMTYLTKLARDEQGDVDQLFSDRET